MDIRAGLVSIGNAQTLQQQGQGGSANAARKTRSLSQEDSILLSRQGQESAKLKTTRLVSENVETLENGFRRTQNFERGNGQKFTRVEEFVSSADRAQRILIQQNGSGSTTRLEEILDRQDNGKFRRTQYYTNEVGEKTTNIDFDIIPNNQDVILGRAPQADAPALPQIARGSTLDIRI